MRGLIRSWGKILTGATPALSLEITRECPLSCPGCYAFAPDHLGDTVSLQQLSDHSGSQLVERFLAVVEQHRPLHVSIVGGEPLVRYRELSEILPVLADRGIYTQVVTSAVRPIPMEWAMLRNLELSVSIDGLQPEHDARRRPATYERILKHIDGHQVTVHCTVTRQQTQRDGYLREFVAFWSQQRAVRKIWISLYTPQVGEVSAERLTARDRARVISDLLALRLEFSKLAMPKTLVDVYRRPPESPTDCIFAQTTTCLSADLDTRIAPCQFGGTPECAECGCVASAGLAAIGRHALPGGLRLESLFKASRIVGTAVRRALPNLNGSAQRGNGTMP